MRSHFFLSLVIAVSTCSACNSCNGRSEGVVHERHVRRMQPGAQNATTRPRGPLEWGQLNFIHTTDTHGWLEGHIKEQNYGADWGDFVSFQRHMKQKAGNLGVDLLLVDTGDLHDGNGLSDATMPNGVLSNPIHQQIDYDLLTIGNHELYISDISYETFSNFSKKWGDKYLTSNIGAKYRYFTTTHGLRIMAYGVIFDFTSNSNATLITKTADMVKEDWFLNSIKTTDPIDIFVVIGHNPVRLSDKVGTFGLVYNAIRQARPDTPIQILGGHTHIRDFTVYDDKSTGIESGRYCETLGWLSLSGINSTSYNGVEKPPGVPNPCRKATNTSTSSMVYSRRYLDWNRRTFAYHASKSQDDTFSTFDLHSGERITGEIAGIRKQLNLSALYGCAPKTLCIYCKPFGDPGSIYSLLPSALSEVVVNPKRATIPRLIIINTGSIRFDLIKGPFTYDDAFIVSPFTNAFQYISDVPYKYAKGVLDDLNSVKPLDKKGMFGAVPLPQSPDLCLDPTISHDTENVKRTATLTRRQTIKSPGYTTTDDFGTDGDDTPHSTIPAYPYPPYIQANGTFPSSSPSSELTVDLIFISFFAKSVVASLNKIAGVSMWDMKRDVKEYMEAPFNVQSYLPEYARRHWQENVPNCPVGRGVGYDD